MSFEESVEQQELLADNFSRAGAGISSRERAGELLLTVAFVAAVAALRAIAPSHAFQIVPVALSAAMLTLAMLVRIDAPFGYTAPTQLAFVPLLFVTPPAAVPIVVVVVLVLAGLRDVFAGEVRLSRLLLTTAPNAWYAIGPAECWRSRTQARPGPACRCWCACSPRNV